MIDRGPATLPHFEDRVLYHLVDLTGDLPVPIQQGVTEMDLALRVAEELGVTEAFIRSPEFHGSQARLTVLTAVGSLKNDGVLKTLPVAGPWRISPTRSGQDKVAQWRKQWAQEVDKAIQLYILANLDKQRRASPDRHTFTARIDVSRLCADLNVSNEMYLANAQRLLQQGKIAESSVEQLTIAEGYTYITEVGVRGLEGGGALGAQRPSEEAWVEVARLKRRLQIVERSPESLIQDEELRLRCEDILAADANYDRVIREACVILEARVRAATGADSSSVGVALMGWAFGGANPSLQLSDISAEQAGVRSLYQGTIAFFRNAVGHRLIDTYSRDDALRFVAWVDLLLAMVARAQPAVSLTDSPNNADVNHGR